MTDLIVRICAANVQDPERFAQTGVGWVMRELSKREPEMVARFVADHRRQLSREASRMATATLSDEQRFELGVTGRRGRR